MFSSTIFGRNILGDTLYRTLRHSSPSLKDLQTDYSHGWTPTRRFTSHARGVPRERARLQPKQVGDIVLPNKATLNLYAVIEKKYDGITYKSIMPAK